MTDEAIRRERDEASVEESLRLAHLAGPDIEIEVRSGPVPQDDDTHDVGGHLCETPGRIVAPLVGDRLSQRFEIWVVRAQLIEMTADRREVDRGVFRRLYLQAWTQASS